jgi:hypothetical protein
VCDITGGPASFSIKAWCDKDVAIADTQYNAIAYGDPCNPTVDITSSIGGCDLLQNSMMWEYLSYI